MARISILVDNAEGHIYPSFGLAHFLKQKGHEIVYLSIPDNKQLITNQGFGFYPIFGDLYPKGPDRRDNTATLAGIMNGVLDPFLEKYSPDLFIINTFLCLETLLLHYKYKIRPVILTPYLRDPRLTMMESCLEYLMKLSGDNALRLLENINSLGVRFSSLPELARPMGSLYEIILCPGELEKDPIPKRRNILYSGPALRQELTSPDECLAGLDGGQKLIYASLGSHTAVYTQQHCLSFYRNMIKAMRDPHLSAFSLLLVVGREYDPRSFGEIPDNVRVVNWAPQIRIIEKASLVITHGGLGTIKESIYHGVPMIVLPVKDDQPRNAGLIEYHHLGLSDKMESISDQQLVSHIKHITGSEQIKLNIARMSRIFKDRDDYAPVEDLIEKAIAEQSCKGLPRV